MAEGTEEKKSGGKGLMIVLVVLIVVLLIAVGGLAYFMLTKEDAPADGAANQEAVVKKAAKDGGMTFKANIDDLVLNITNSRGREKLMKLSFAVKSTEPTIMAIVEEFKPEIIDRVISQISARSSEELLTVGGKALLKEELIDDINSVINDATSTNAEVGKDNVKQLYFTTFVIK